MHLQFWGSVCVCISLNFTRCKFHEMQTWTQGANREPILSTQDMYILYIYIYILIRTFRVLSSEGIKSSVRPSASAEALHNIAFRSRMSAISKFYYRNKSILGLRRYQKHKVKLVVCVANVHPSHL